MATAPRLSMVTVHGSSRPVTVDKSVTVTVHGLFTVMVQTLPRSPSRYRAQSSGTSQRKPRSSGPNGPREISKRQIFDPTSRCRHARLGVLEQSVLGDEEVLLSGRNLARGEGGQELVLPGGVQRRWSRELSLERGYLLLDGSRLPLLEVGLHRLLDGGQNGGIQGSQRGEAKEGGRRRGRE